MDITKQAPAADPVAPAAEPAPAAKPKKVKKDKKKDSRSTVAEVMHEVSSWVMGAVILAVAAAFMFGPAIANELREDEIMSILDMSEDELADTSTGDLIDIRKYAEEYKSRDAVNERAAEKVERILDEAIEDRIK